MVEAEDNFIRKLKNEEFFRKKLIIVDVLLKAFKVYNLSEQSLFLAISIVNRFMKSSYGAQK